MKLLILLASLMAAWMPAATATAISNGVPDGDGHPYVGLLAVQGENAHGETVKFALCSGSFAGSNIGGPGQVFLTAGHCVAWLPGAGTPAEALFVTFDSTPMIDASGEVVAGSWFQATDFAVDPGFGHDFGNLRDYGVVILAGVPGGLTPVRLPTNGLLDAMAARGGLVGESFTNVGYGLVPSATGRPQFVAPEGRLVSSSLFKGLTRAFLKLQMNSHVGSGNGGICSGDSGSPKLIPGTDTAVAVTTAADTACRAESANQRLDTPEARAFLDDFLPLP